ncbi:hypothetical protein [Paractinoplanes lichenicola]|uniref:DUF3800 domain-containing protein n=1 Tax=Paractinoplanes lichenicola TaxID=2802976 RepID=A0ABS1VXS0_9ACTN|nr:hypothetical protein [Actinoplanes lichenicola]MBL7259294.1 hypothetical protein [Actinoplanes lichenicola]
MRTPMQGGLLPVQAGAGPVVRIACDESGFSGTNLLHPGMPTITHASVDLSVDEAAELVGRLGAATESGELKSGRFLRAGRKDWFQEALRGRAYVHVVDKRFFLVTRIVDMVLYEPSYASGTRLTQGQRADAVALAQAVRESSGLLPAFVELVRTKRRRPASETVERFLAAAEHVVEVEPARVWALAARLDEDDREVPPPLEPLLPALAETVLTWSGGERRVLVTHDEQSALTAGRLARLQRALTGDGGVSPLAGFAMADSRDDPRVQVADLLAGLARRQGVDESLLTPTSWKAPKGAAP